MFITQMEMSALCSITILFNTVCTLKTPGSAGTRKKGGQLGPNGSMMTRKSVKFTNNGVRLTQLLVIFRVKLTDFRVIVYPEWSLAPMDPFPGHADPVVFIVCFKCLRDLLAQFTF